MSDKNTIIRIAKDKINTKFEQECIDYGYRVLSQSFDPKNELRELQIKAEARTLAIDLVSEILEEVL